MRWFAAVAVLMFGALCAYGQQAKPCEELKDEIAKKLDAKGVVSYTLDIVDKDKEAEGKVVGTCGGGTKKIIYNRGTKPAETPAPPKDDKKS